MKISTSRRRPIGMSKLSPTLQSVWQKFWFFETGSKTFDVPFPEKALTLSQPDIACRPDKTRQTSSSTFRHVAAISTIRDLLDVPETIKCMPVLQLTFVSEDRITIDLNPLSIACFPHRNIFKLFLIKPRTILFHNNSIADSGLMTLTFVGEGEISLPSNVNPGLIFDHSSTKNSTSCVLFSHLKIFSHWRGQGCDGRLILSKPLRKHFCPWWILTAFFLVLLKWCKMFKGSWNVFQGLYECYNIKNPDILIWKYTIMFRNFFNDAIQRCFICFYQTTTCCGNWPRDRT